MEGFDHSVFKILANNDTGKAPGHQGGIVIPKDIANFFPPLTFSATPDTPTVETILTAELFHENRYIETVLTRYQHQTWGGSRSPERRLTANLGALRNKANAGDILVFEKNLIDPLQIRIRLLPAGASEHRAIVDLNLGSKNWGVSDPSLVPVSIDDYEAAIGIMEMATLSPFDGFAFDRTVVESRNIRLARSAVFRIKVLNAYDRICAISREVLVAQKGNVNLDAAHIISIEKGGSDDPRNGLALSKDLHWAFDKGLIGVDENRQVLIANPFDLKVNQSLSRFRGLPIQEAKDKRDMAAGEAFAWHRQNIFCHTPS